MSAGGSRERGGDGRGGGGGGGNGGGRGRGKYDGDSRERRVRKQSKQSRYRDGNQKGRSFPEEETRLREFRTRGPASSLVGISKYIEATSCRVQRGKSERVSHSPSSPVKSEPVSRKTKSGKEKSPDKDDNVGTREEGDGASADGKVSPEWTKAQAEKQGGTEPVSEKPNGSGEVTFGHQCPRVSAHARLGPRDPGGDVPAAKESDGSRGATAGKSKEEKGSGIRDYEKEGFIGCRPKEPRNSARAPNASVRPERP